MTDLFKGAELLSPEENLFGRVLIKNALATQEQVETCARETIDGPEPTLEDALVKGGVVSASTIERVRAAIEKKLSERGMSTSSFAPPGASGVLDPVNPEKLRRTPTTTLAGKQERLEKFVKQFVRSRFHRQLLEHVLADQIGILSAGKFAKRLGVESARVTGVFEEWKAGHLVKSNSTHRHVFGPTSEQLEDVRELMRMWTNARTHSTILGWILRQEFA